MAIIIKVDDDHWTVNGKDIRYNDSFAFSGWYVDDNPNRVFPDVYDDFLTVLEIAMGEDNTTTRVLNIGIG